MYVGQVVRGRLRAVRYRETVRGVAGEIVNGNFVVTAAGTVAWTVGPGPQDRDVHSVGAVWPRGSEVSQVPVPDQPSYGAEMPAGRPIFVLNDHAVQVDGRGVQPFIFRPGTGTGGACADIIDGRTTSLAGWRLSVTSRSSAYFAPKTGGSSTSHLVCDPASGRYISTGTSAFSYGVTGYSRVRAIVRAGDRLLVERESVGPLGFGYADEVDVIDAATGTSRHVVGWITGPGTTPPTVPQVPPPPGMEITGAGVAAAPGVFASIERSDAGPSASLTVEDADGMRRLSTGTSITGLALDGDRLRWTTDGVPGDAVVTPAAAAPFAVGPSVDVGADQP